MEKKKINVEIDSEVCYRVKASIENYSATLEEDNTIRITGHISANSDYEKVKKLSVKADLCDSDGRVLYVLRSYQNHKIDITGRDSFELHCCEVDRFVPIEELSKVLISPYVQ